MVEPERLAFLDKLCLVGTEKNPPPFCLPPSPHPPPPNSACQDRLHISIPLLWVEQPSLQPLNLAHCHRGARMTLRRIVVPPKGIREHLGFTVMLEAEREANEPYVQFAPRSMRIYHHSTGKI